jgi:ribonuclease III
MTFENSFALINQALVHQSYAFEHKIESNERLELLGDSVISLVCIDYLYSKYPQYDEGELTQLKTYMVNGKQLSLIGEKLGLNKRVKLGTGEVLSAKTVGRAFEALIGAYYLTTGFESTKKCLTLIFNQMDSGEIEQILYNYKGDLQKFSQFRFKEDPHYEVTKQSGQPHEREYTVKVIIKSNKKLTGIGSGKSKKEAEQQSAKNLLAKLAETSND